jgi:hypothetical protein
LLNLASMLSLRPILPQGQEKKKGSRWPKAISRLS